MGAALGCWGVPSPALLILAVGGGLIPCAALARPQEPPHPAGRAGGPLGGGVALRPRVGAPAGAVSAEAATRPRQEPSWHRRARRARSDARVIVRIAAAKSRLAGHHSSPFGGMPGGGAAGGRGARNGGGAPTGANGAGFQAARQFFLSLFGDGAQSVGRAGAGGKGGGSNTRRSGNGVRTREGEWGCRCGYANRAFRQQCNACGRARPAGDMQPERGGKGGGARSGSSGKDRVHSGSEGRRGGCDGPVGADGARPLLGRFGAGIDALPAAAASSAGKAGQRKGEAAGLVGGGGGKGAFPRAAEEGAVRRPPTVSGGKPGELEPREAGGRPLGAWAKPLRMVDEEGYTLVQPRRAWQPSGGAGGGGAAAESAPQATHGPVTRPRWSDEDSDDDMHAAEDDEAEELADAGTNGGGEQDPRRLRTRFEALARAARDMERRAKGGAEDPAVLALKSARDEAEQEWRQAKSPAPLPTRMGRAQAKLEKAGAALSKARFAVDDFDEWCDARRAVLVQRVEEADSWYRWRQQQMQALHDEAGKTAVGSAGSGSAAAAHGEAISERIVSEWLPEVQALLEHLQGNPEVEERLASMAASMQCAGQELSAVRADAVEAYDIAGDDDWNQDWGGCDEQPSAPGKGGDAWQDSEPKGGSACWRPEGPGRWARATSAQGKGPAVAMGQAGTHDIAGGGGTADTGAATAAGAASDASRAQGSGSKRGAEESADDGAALRQRTDAESRDEADRKRATELMQRQQEAIAAQQASHEAGQGGFGSATAQAVAAQQFITDACKAVAQARKIGVEPKSHGKELVELSPMELRQWMSDNLGDEAGWA